MKTRNEYSEWYDAESQYDAILKMGRKVQHHSATVSKAKIVILDVVAEAEKVAATGRWRYRFKC